MEVRLHPELHAAIEFLPIPVGISDYDGRIHYVNRKFTELFGYQLADIPHVDRWFEQAYPNLDYRRQVIVRWQLDINHARTQGIAPLPRLYSIVTKDGRSLDVEIRFQAQANQLFVVFQDMTELRRASRALTQSQRNFNAFFNTIQDMLFVLDQAGLILHVNRTLCQRLGYTAEELIGQAVHVLHPPEYQADAWPSLQAVLAQRAEWCSAPVMTKDQRRLPVEMRVIRGEWNDRPAIFGVATDMSSLTLSAEKFSTAFHTESIMMGISAEADGKFIDVNQAFLETLGYARAEVIGHTALELGLYADPADRARVLRIVQEQGRVKNIELQVRGRDGRLHSGLFSIDKTTVGGVPCWLTTMSDITTLKQAETALRDSEERYRLLFQRLPVGVFHYDTQLVITDTNDRFVHILRSKRELLLGLNLNHLRDGGGLPALRQALEGKEGIFEGHYQATTSEASIWITLHTAPLWREGVIIGGVAIVEDISERKQAEEALREREENLRITLNSIGEAVIAVDMDGRIVRLNPVAEELTGWTQPAAKGIPLATAFHLLQHGAQDAVQNPVDLVRRAGEPVGPADYTLQNDRQNTIRYISASAAPIRNAAEQMVGVVLVFRDITTQHLLEEQLRQSQKMDALGRLAGGVAHDFNNMLAGILGSADLLAQKLSADSPQRRQVKLIKESAEKAALLTRQLLAFSRKAQVSTATIDVHEALLAAIALLERSIDPRVQIVMQLAAQQTSIIGETALLESAFLNLALNARDAMPEGGTVTFFTSNLELDEDYCAAHASTLQPGPYIEVSVTDSGVGIPQDALPKIFEPFYTTKGVGQGTGLGLAAVYGAIKAHRGLINVYSEVGVGTAFRVYLPINTTAPPRSATDETVVFGHGDVLVIDDEAVVRRTVDETLRSLGYGVLLAEDGEQGVEIFSREKHHIALVLLDMVMPKLSGQATFERLRAIDPQVKVIFSSGFDREGSAAEVVQSGQAAFIQKPYQRAALSRTLAAALDKL